MNSVEFERLLAAADLNDLGVADLLDVEVSTVLDWHLGVQPIPAWAVERLRARAAELAGPPPGRGVDQHDRP